MAKIGWGEFVIILVIALLVLGFPVWLPLLIAAFAVVLSLYIALWAVVISFWAVVLSLAVGGLGSLVAAAAQLVSGLDVHGKNLHFTGVVCCPVKI